MGSMNDGSEPADIPAVKKAPAGVQVLDVEPIVEPDAPVVTNKSEKAPANGAVVPKVNDTQNVNNDPIKAALDNEKAPSVNPNAAAGKAKIDLKTDVVPSPKEEIAPGPKEDSAKTEEVNSASTKVDSKTAF
jgi:hypothetical protein